jgi:hypothetical protein
MGSLIGKVPRELIIGLAHTQSEIQAVSLTTYTPGPNLEGATDVAPSPALVRRALRHRGYPEALVEVPIAGAAASLMNPPPSGRVRAICSRVRLRAGATGHIPLLDFRCGVSETAAEAILVGMQQLGETEGVLLESGRSYHYYGLIPRDLGEWRRLMVRSLLLTPWIDARYVAHCLLEDLACLRIDTVSEHPKEPLVVAELRP